MSYRTGTIDLTDTGMADALVDACSKDWRYVHDIDTWLRWDGTVWRRDKVGGIYIEARAVVEETMATVDSIDDDKARSKAYQAWTARQSTRALEAQVRIARVNPSIALLSEQLDAHPMLLSTPVGAVDLETGKLRTPDRGLLMTRKTRAAYDRAAASDVWTTFLADVTLGDEELTRWLQQAVGMSLIGDQREQIAIFCYGIGKNGKTTFLDAICYALGDYATKAAPDIVTASRNDRHPTEVMDLKAKRCVIVDEFKGNASIDESKLKRLTGGGMTKARAMGKDFVDFPNTWQLWLDGNSRPRVSGQDEGIWRRLRLVPWRLHVEEEHRDRDLSSKLQAAAPAILRWAVDGCRDYLEAGRLPPCEAVDAGTKAYRLEQDMIGSWLADTYAIESWEADPSRSAWTPSAHVVASANTWCNGNNIRPWTPNQLAQELQQRGCQSEKRSGVRGWLGLDPSAFMPANHPSGSNNDDGYTRWH
jgi:putative DNA primase/helicase